MNYSDTNVKKLSEDVFQHMLSTRREKYEKFFKDIKLFKLMSMSITKGNFLKSYYAYHHYIDDVVDTDSPLPIEYSSSVEFIEDRIDFAKTLVNPRLPIDYLLLYCYELAEKLNLDYSEETLDILNSMHFDAKRQGKYIIFPEQQLHYHFHLLDIKGTIKGTLKLFGEDPEKYSVLEPLGLATRLYYNLRDYEEDIDAGLINISLEDVHRFGIPTDDIRNTKDPNIRSWFANQSKQGLDLLEQHNNLVKFGNFGILARLTFPKTYIKPAKRYFDQILMNYQ